MFLFSGSISNKNFSTTMQLRSQLYFTTQSPSLSITSYKSKFKSSSIFLNIKNKCMYAPTLDNCIFYVVELLLCYKKGRIKTLNGGFIMIVV